MFGNLLGLKKGRERLRLRERSGHDDLPSDGVGISEQKADTPAERSGYRVGDLFPRVLTCLGVFRSSLLVSSVRGIERIEEKH